MAEASSGLVPGSIVAGKLRVIRILGEGGMGAVFEVEHEYTKHRRALKLLHAEMTQIAGVVERFLREASAAGRIGSPHIVETFDAGRLDSGEPYIVMEMLKGRPLDSVVEEGGTLDIAETVEILRQACAGIQAAHDAGIIHRDLKPENLFLCAGDRPFVKILDFGISKFDPAQTGDHALTQEGSALGTPFYMPPEQVRGVADLDERADVYALGVVLYECLTGKKPFDADSLPHLAVLIHEGNYEPVAQLRPDAPPQLIEVVDRAMASDRDKRFSSVRELSEALGAVPTGPISPSARTIIAPSSVTQAIAAKTAPAGTPERAADAAVGTAGGSEGASDASSSGAGQAAPGGARRWAPVVVIVAVAAVGAVAAGLTLGRDDESAEAGPEPVASAAADPEAEADEPKVRPILPEEQPAPVARPAPAPEPAPAPVAGPAPPRPAPAPAAPRPSPNTRAAKQGLAEENPF